MLEFHTIDRNDRDEANRMLAASDFRGCEYSFANNLAWHRLYKTRICFYDGFYITLSEYGELHFMFPAGRGDFKALFSKLKEYSAERGEPLRISSVTDEGLQLLHKLYGEKFTVTADEDGFDYIYNASDLRELPGKKYRKKRGHLKKLEEYDYAYSPLSPADFDECIAFAAVCYNENGSYGESEAAEQYAINTFFSEFEYLGLSGGVLRVDGKVAAFTVGEVINSDTADIHIEKADKNIGGAYQGINYFYARSLPENVKYINREEDMGLEGLRRSKQSYYPAFMLKKYTVTFGE